MKKFKIGQKVLVKVWYDMPQDIQDGWGILTRCIGNILTVVAIGEKYKNINLYELEGKAVGEMGLIVLEPEIEPIIKVGEQLLFDFVKE